MAQDLGSEKEVPLTGRTPLRSNERACLAVGEGGGRKSHVATAV
jgi:hypothetical protein